MPYKFWIVYSWGNHYQGRVKRYATPEKASEVAGLLAKSNPDVKFYVLESLEYKEGITTVYGLPLEQFGKKR